MKISLIQTDIFWADKKTNFQKIENKLKTLKGQTDLAVLPEMFSTGFCTDRLELAEKMEGETVQTLKRWAKDFDFAIAGSFIATENGRTYNRGFFVLPSGEIFSADKRHLFSLSSEHELFYAGDKKLIVSYKEFNILLLICYDIRFPVWSRNVNNKYDLLIYTANFPASKMDIWDTLLRARSIENQAYVCGVNRIGTDGLDIPYSGHSALFDYKGKLLTDFKENAEEIKTIEISKEKLIQSREKFIYWKDSDRFEIK